MYHICWWRQQLLIDCIRKLLISAMVIDKLPTKYVDDGEGNRQIHTRMYCGTRCLPIGILCRLLPHLQRSVVLYKVYTLLQHGERDRNWIRGGYVMILLVKYDVTTRRFRNGCMLQESATGVDESWRFFFRVWCCYSRFFLSWTRTLRVLPCVGEMCSNPGQRPVVMEHCCHNNPENMTVNAHGQPQSTGITVYR